MGRSPCCSREGLNRGAWTAKEDRILCEYIKNHGEGGWRNLPKKAGLKRCGKSCRLRWLNYLRPDIKRGNISEDEEELIIRLHKLLGNRWSLIAGRLPGRTDNEIKNYWNTHLSKKFQRLSEHVNGSSDCMKSHNQHISSSMKPRKLKTATQNPQSESYKPSSTKVYPVKTVAIRPKITNNMHCPSSNNPNANEGQYNPQDMDVSLSWQDLLISSFPNDQPPPNVLLPQHDIVDNLLDFEECDVRSSHSESCSDLDALHGNNELKQEQEEHLLISANMVNEDDWMHELEKLNQSQHKGGESLCRLLMDSEDDWDLR